ncbi:MAG: hypothetical protein ACRDYC_13075 [Acidimicrobiales bacterium]
MHVELPEGHSAELREKATVGGRDLLREHSVEVFGMVSRRWPGARKIEDIPRSELDAATLRGFHLFNRAAVVALLKGWTFSDPLPTMETITEMDPDVYDILAEAVALPAVKTLMGREYKPEEAPDAESPTEPSSDSIGRGPDQTIPETNLPTGS